MQIPLSWLEQYVDIKDYDIKTLCGKLTGIGTTVEAVTYVGSGINKVVIGKVNSIKKHPNANKLFITKIDIGNAEGAEIQIVTGAANLYEGAYVPVALPGATLANGVKIEKGILRGEISDGMLVSIEEFGFTTVDYPEAPENGIYIFNNTQGLVLGSDAKKALEIDETVIEFGLTSNRPDCYSVLGIARETSAALDTPLKYEEGTAVEKAGGDASSHICVEILNTELCPRYMARVVKNVKIQPSPQWMRRRLANSGIRPINNIVDITNYVMLELGQPMHAFDIDNISGRKIIVRNAKSDEIFTTLDGERHKLDSSMLVIADEEKAVALAGVMGGENSKVTGTASAILFESANFNGTNIRLSSKKLGLRTDSSGKYERGLDPNLAAAAINRAAELVEQLGCGEVVRGVVDCYPNKREKIQIQYKPEKINALLGTDIPGLDMEAYLARVFIRAKNGIADIPTFRADISCEADIAEEVARIYGYTNIKPTLAVGKPTAGIKTKGQKYEDMLKTVMSAQGLCESLSYAFESPKVFDKLLIPKDSALRNAITLLNPLGEDYSVMRTTTLNSMLSSLSLNFNRRNEEASLYEISKTYIPKSLPLTELPDEIPLLTIGMYGKAGFYDIKGIAETIFEAFGIKSANFEADKTLPYMHPGRCAKISISGCYAGFLGETHPHVAANYEIGTKVYIAVIDINTLFNNACLINAYVPLPKYPGIKRDIAILVNDNLTVAEIESEIKLNGGEILEGVKLFDVYKGAHTPENQKSVGYSLYFRDAGRTLTDDEVSSAMSCILAALEKKTGAVLRDK